MICWFDNGYARWFYVQEWSAGSWGFVESWKVYNEIPTPHC
jgi:hypothetical protein